jgi:hypothetical protein
MHRLNREQPIVAVEYEYRCAEYEYNGKRSTAMIWLYFAYSQLRRTVLVIVLVVSSDTSMMHSAKITIGGPSFPPGSSRWKQQLTAT